MVGSETLDVQEVKCVAFVVLMSGRRRICINGVVRRVDLNCDTSYLLRGSNDRLIRIVVHVRVNTEACRGACH